MATIVSESVCFKVISFLVVVSAIQPAEVDAFAYRHAIVKLDKEPVISGRLSIVDETRNGSIVAKEVINHVHHQHEQTIGNVHVLTNINIANLVTIFNKSVSAIDRPSDATTNPGKRRKKHTRNHVDFL